MPDLSELEEQASRMAEQALALTKALRPYFAGLHPGVQGAVLAELAGIWLAGHSAEDRERILQLHVYTIKKLAEMNAGFASGRRLDS